MISVALQYDSPIMSHMSILRVEREGGGEGGGGGGGGTKGEGGRRKIKGEKGKYRRDHCTF